MVTCYHGTAPENVASIMINGFWPDSWFARRIEHAYEFGGPAILEVEFPDDVWDVVERETPDLKDLTPTDSPWQFHCPKAIAADRIIRVSTLVPSGASPANIPARAGK